MIRRPPRSTLFPTRRSSDLAQIWRSLYREQQLRSQVLSNPHSPPKFRVNGVVRNVDAWYAAFAVQPRDKLYRSEEHTSELQSRSDLVCRLLLEKKKVYVQVI